MRAYDLTALRAQVLDAIKNGISSDWTGCIRSGNCCVSYGLSPKSISDPDFWEHITAAHSGNVTNEIEEYKNMSLDQQKINQRTIDHKCDQLIETPGMCSACKIYKNRPKTCRDFLCDDAKIRKKLYNEYTNK